MSKVNTLFKKYYRILNEQEPTPEVAPSPEAAPAEMTPDPTTPEIKPLKENEKYIIKILTNAFIFNPSLFNGNKRKYIENKIYNIKKSINIPVAEVVEEIKNILNLDNSLRVESKTLKMIEKFLLVLEQPADATEPQVDAPTSGTDQPNDSDANQSSGIELNLAEIFPLYKELIIQSLAHIPTDEELIILKPVVNEFASTDPEKIVKTIKDLLGQESDEDIESDLANV